MGFGSYFGGSYFGRSYFGGIPPSAFSVSVSETISLSDTITNTLSVSVSLSDALSLVDTVQIFVPPVPPAPSPQQGGGGSGSVAGAHRQTRTKRTRVSSQRSTQLPDNSLPENRSDFRKIERQLATDRDDDDILEILGMFLSVKDRRE
jgi:hypothetical protein